MTTFTLIRRSLSFHARSHLGALLGAAVGSAVLIGALAVGDSVRASLRGMALARLGSTEVALSSNDRFFRTVLADKLAQSLSAPVVPIIQIQGTATANGGSARANRVQVLGVSDPFWKFGAAHAPFPAPGPEEVVLNQPLAKQLQVKVGDSVLLRVEKPSHLSREAPISPQEDFAMALRATVRAVAPEEQMGRFSLHANQVAPFNAFVSAAWLGERLQLPGRANLLLVDAGPKVSLSTATAALREHWELTDAELELRDLPDAGGVELRTRRVFLDPATAEAALNVSSNATGILTYFVNALQKGTKAAPYSMVTAMGPPLVPADMRANEMIINQWLADDLDASVGDRLTLSYFTIGTARTLQEQTNEFTIRAVIPLSGAAADPGLMPEFPGLDKAESTRDWDSSLPIQLAKIRPKDEEYWKNHRGTPKAFLTLTAGQAIWTNRFGNLTAVRFPAGTDKATIGAALLRALDPVTLGFSFQPVRQQALAASAQGQDFGQLFLGFSFFLIAAALLLMALLFQFGVEKRRTEVGTLLAVGFTPARVRRLLLAEGAALALAGAIIGVPGGIVYAHAMLYGLSTIWRSAIGTSALRYHVSGLTLVLGACAGILVALGTIWLALRKQARKPARELLAEGGDLDERSAHSKRSRGIWIGWIASALAMLLIGWSGMQEQGANPEMFFSAGSLLLISGLGFASAFLSALGVSEAATRPSLGGMGVRNATRRRRRSLATIGLLACGSFLVGAIGVFKLEDPAQVQKRGSGTGGFALLGEATLPIVHDLNTEAGRQFFGLSSNDLPGVRFVSLRVRDGEDASCLNLNRAQTPRLLGVRAAALSERGAFTFAGVASGLSAQNPWALLEQTQVDGSIPAIGDAASIQWALGKKLGDTLSYTDERGRLFKVRLVAAVANSILQGSLIVDERAFSARFPSESGYRMFLIDAPAGEPASLKGLGDTLSRATQDYGLQVTPAIHRLAEFNAVQNTYLNTFQVLGGLGLLLGSIGLGVVVLRNVLERRGELGLLTAVGFRARALQWLVVSEHGALILLGLLIGLIAAGVAVLPSLSHPGAAVPFRSLALTLTGILVSGAVWTWIATRLALRGRLLDSLRND